MKVELEEAHQEAFYFVCDANDKHIFNMKEIRQLYSLREIYSM